MNKETKIHLGCGNKRFANFVNVDVARTASVDVVGQASDLSRFKDHSVSLIYSHAVFEHVYGPQQLVALREWKRALAPGGVAMAIGLPDFFEIARCYVEGKEGVIGPQFDLYNVYRFSHGEPEGCTAPVWKRWRSEKVPSRAPHGWLPQLHKTLFDDKYLAALLDYAGWSYRIFRYAFPDGPPHPVNLGFLAQPKRPGAAELPPEIIPTLERIPDVETVVDLASIQPLTPACEANQMLEFFKKHEAGDFTQSFASRVITRLIRDSFGRLAPRQNK